MIIFDFWIAIFNFFDTSGASPSHKKSCTQDKVLIALKYISMQAIGLVHVRVGFHYNNLSVAFAYEKVSKGYLYE